MNILITRGSGLVTGRLLSYLSDRYEIYVHRRSLKTIKDNIILIKYNKLVDNIHNKIIKYIQRIER